MKRIIAPLAIALAATGAAAQDFPARAITFVVPFGAGSATDTLARAVGQAISTETKQAVVIDNKPGASGMIAASAVAKAPADGYTLLVASAATAINNTLAKNLTWEAARASSSHWRAIRIWSPRSLGHSPQDSCSSRLRASASASTSIRSNGRTASRSRTCKRSRTAPMIRACSGIR